MVTIIFTISSPETVTGLLPTFINQQDRDAIQNGLQNTQNGIRETTSAVFNTGIRIWMENKK